MLEPHATFDDPSPFNSILRVAWKTMYKAAVHRDSNTSLDSMCTIMNQHAHDAKGNRVLRFPGSAHMLRGMLGMRDAHTYERHVCPICWTPHPRIEHSRGAWNHHANDRCACGEPRFIREKGVLRPACRYWVRSIQEVIQSFCTDTNIMQQIGTSRANPPTGSFLDSPYCRYLDETCRYKISRPEANEIAILFGAGANMRAYMTRTSASHVTVQNECTRS